MRSRILAAFAVSALAAAPLSAQQMSVTTFGGAFIPLRSMVIDTTGGSGTYFRLTPHTVYGLRISKTMSPALTLQFQGGIGQGGFEAISTGEPLPLESTVWFADLRARFRFMGNDDTNLGAIGGLGWTQYGMALFEAAHELDENTQMTGRITGIIGVGMKAKLIGNVSLTADLTDRVHEHSIDIDALSPGAIEPLQHDVAFSVGLNFPLGD